MSGILSCKVISNPNSLSFSVFFTKSFSMVSPTYRHSEFGANWLCFPEEKLNSESFILNENDVKPVF